MLEKLNLPEYSFKLPENRTKIKSVKQIDLKNSLVTDFLKTKNARFALISTDRIEDSNVFTNYKQFLMSFARAMRNYTKTKEMENSSLYAIMRVKKVTYLLFFNFETMQLDSFEVANRFIVSKIKTIEA